MSASTSKNDEIGIRDESGENEDNTMYCKNMVPILTQIASDDFMAKQIHQELEIERLTRENEDIDEKIAAKLKKLEETRKISANLDLELYNQSQTFDQTKANFETTGEILTVLFDEAKKMQSHAETLENKRIEMTAKMQGCIDQKKKIDEMKIKSSELQKQVRELEDAPEPTLDENLSKRNEELRKQVQEKKKAFEMARMKKNRRAEMMERKMDLLTQITEKQEAVRIKKEQVEKKRANIKRAEELDEKKEIMQKKIKMEESKRDELLQKMADSKKRCDLKQLKMEEQKARIANKETKLKILKEKCAAKQESIKNEQEKKQQEYEIEKRTLLEWEEKDRVITEENLQNNKILHEKTQTLLNLKSQEMDLTNRINKKKIEIVTHQCNKQRHEYTKEKLRLEREENEKLKIRSQKMEKTYKDVQKKLEECPAELKKKWEKLESQHNEKIEVLLKRQSVKKAILDIEQHNNDKLTQEVDKLKTKVQGMKDEHELEEIAISRREVNLKALMERAKRQEQEYKMLLVQAKQKKQESFTTVVSQETESEKGITGILMDQSNVTEMKEPEVMERVDIIENEDTVSNGRKSPGILKKSPVMPKRSLTPTKRVTFGGIPSESSSSQSLDVKQNANKVVKEQTLDEMLANWKNVVPKTNRKKNV